MVLYTVMLFTVNWWYMKLWLPNLRIAVKLELTLALDYFPWASSGYHGLCSAFNQTFFACNTK